MVCDVSLVAWDSGLCSPMVEVGIFKARIDDKSGGREIAEFCFMDELCTRFWQHRVGLCAPEPHGRPFRVIIGPSQSWMCGCSLAHGVFTSK